MIVLDASAALAWSHKDETTPAIDDVLRRVVSQGALVPALWPTEIANALRVAVRENRISTEIRSELLANLWRLKPVVEEIDLEVVSTRTMALADRHDLTVYDATYLELALRHALLLATTDKKLASAARAEGVEVLP